MIEVLLGSKSAERVLIYIFSREEGYAREIARFFQYRSQIYSKAVG